ncbi:gonadotropin releasing hormone receptor 4 isoform X1 [Nothobranchius furzeri]|nr:gonadotropin releasing hormone receptor 4 isoform X1 [Nothobranchius furzeri]XP_015820006.1 gonadotropin releasing hormone receptor 4 isoform X1 [Nothobranchius furzeri]KAF7224477.1 transcript variant X1 [Nothobranchius furzeri]KAF7224478.1 transcript variant X2 [Nothobranchius furzeri]
MMFDQLTDQTLNSSCQGSALDCNKSADDGDALQLPTFSTAAKVRVIITFTLCAVSAVCNLLVLWAAGKGGKRKSHVRILIMNLTVADLLVTFIVMPVDAAWNITVQWQAGDAACRLLMFMKLVAMYSCAFVTVVISLDRQSAILNPLGITEAKRKSKIMLSVAWSMSVVLSLPQMFIFHNVTITVPENFTQCTTHGSFVHRWQETLYNMFTFTCLFLLPLVIMIFCYARILIEISSRMAQSNILSRDVHLRRSHSNIPKARMRTLKMSIVIVTSFIICWTPYYLLGLWYWLFPERMEETVSHSLTHMLFIFGLFNACLDPITYGLFTIHFHQGLRRRRQDSNTRTELENDTCLRQMSCLSSHRQFVSRSGSKRAEEVNDNGDSKKASTPNILVSKI